MGKKKKSKKSKKSKDLNEEIDEEEGEEEGVTKLIQNPVFLVVRRKKTSIYLEMSEHSSVFDVKRQISLIIGVPWDKQKLYLESNPVDSHEISNGHTMYRLGLGSGVTQTWRPRMMYLTILVDMGWGSKSHEPLCVVPYSTPLSCSEYIQLMLEAMGGTVNEENETGGLLDEEEEEESTVPSMIV